MAAVLDTIWTPANSGYAYTSRSLNWAQFDMAFSSARECEQHALHNQPDSSSPTDCANSLDDIVNGEELSGQPVMWYSQSRTVRPRRENFPAISSMLLDFTLMPFDWTATSPFEAVHD